MIKKLIILFFLLPTITMGLEKTREYGLCHVYYSHPNEKALVENLNVQWVRNDFNWEKVEPIKGKWDFTYYDQMVEGIRKNDKRILGILDYDAPWLHSKGKSLRKITRENIPHFLKYVENTVRRYKGKVDAWEIWNEPNNPSFWKLKDEDFFELVKQTSALIKSIDPNIFLVSGSLWLSPYDYLEKMFKSGAFEKADALSYHPYSASSQFLPYRIKKMKSIMDRYNFKGEVWITEFGFPTHGVYPTRKLEPKDYSNEVIKSLTYFAASKITKIFWYTLFDAINPGEKGDSRFNSEKYFGLAFPNGELKNGGRSFSHFTKLVGSKKYDASLLIQDLGRDKHLRAYRFFDDQNQNVLVIWRNGILTKKIRFNGEIFNLKSHNIISGETKPISFDALTINNNPQIFTFTTSNLLPLHIESL
jgi:polysaccharide biosynthesis protein PslG